MLADEGSQKTLEITYRGAKISARVLMAVSKSLLAWLQAKQNDGQVSMKKLSKEKISIESIPVSNEDIKAFKHELKKYGVKFTVRQSKAEKDAFNLYYTSRDVTQIKSALENYVTKSMTKGVIKERMENAVQKAKDIAAAVKEQRSRTKGKAKEAVR